MAATIPGQVPYASVGTPSDFSVASNAALRKRKMAEMLDAQMFKPNEIGLSTPGARMSWASALAPLLQGYVSNKLGKEADKEESDAAAAAQTKLDDLLQNMPQDIPGTPEVPGTPDIPAQPAANAAFGPAPESSPLALSGGAQPPTPDLKAMSQKLLGGQAPAPEPMLTGAGETPFMLPQRGETPMVPGRPRIPAVPGKPASPDDWLAYAGKFQGLGPTAAKYGDVIASKAIDKKFRNPDEDYKVTANGDVLSFKDRDAEGRPTFLPITGPMTKQKADELAENHRAQRKAEADTLEEKIRRNQATETETNRYHTLLKQMNDDRIEARQAARDAAASGNKMTPTSLVDKDQNPLAYDSKTNTLVKMGVPSTPGASNVVVPGKEGQQVFRVGDTKSLDKAADLQAAIARGDDLANKIEADFKASGGKGAYSDANNFKNYINTNTGGALFHKDERLTPAQVAMRANAGRSFSKEIKDTFGTAVTNREGKTAADYDLKPFMNGQEVANMLRAQSQFRREAMEQYPEKFKSVAKERTKEIGTTPSASASAVRPPAGASAEALLKFYNGGK